MSDVDIFPGISIGYTPYLMGVMERRMTIIAGCEFASGNEIPKGIHHCAVSFFSEVITILEKEYPQYQLRLFSRAFPILRRVMAKILNVQVELMEDSVMLPWLKTARAIVAKANTPGTFETEEIQVLQKLPLFFHDLEVYGRRDLQGREYASWDTDDGDD